MSPVRSLGQDFLHGTSMRRAAPRRQCSADHGRRQDRRQRIGHALARNAAPSVRRLIQPLVVGIEEADGSMPIEPVSMRLRPTVSPNMSVTMTSNCLGFPPSASPRYRPACATTDIGIFAAVSVATSRQSWVHSRTFILSGADLRLHFIAASKATPGCGSALVVMHGVEAETLHLSIDVDLYAARLAEVDVTGRLHDEDVSPATTSGGRRIGEFGRGSPGAGWQQPELLADVAGRAGTLPRDCCPIAARPRRRAAPRRRPGPAGSRPDRVAGGIHGNRRAGPLPSRCQSRAPAPLPPRQRFRADAITRQNTTIGFLMQTARAARGATRASNSRIFRHGAR